MKNISRAIVTAVALSSAVANAWDFRGEVAGEGRYFTDGPGYTDYWHNGSAYAKGELYHEWNDRNDIFTFIPYARVDENDSERTHADIRELSWIHVASQWESRVGIRKVFWGVTEGRHLVDIINQTDLVDQVDGEEKLGQPMINVSTVQDWGILDVYLLPGFRERTFPGEDGRPRLPVNIDVDNALYESSAEDTRVDAAIRLQMFFGNAQVALSHFSGTSRDPLLLPNVQDLTPPERLALLQTGQLPAGFDATLTPYYNVIDQSGMELQYLLDGWLLKLEAISRSGQGDRYTALDGGFEYTQVALFGSDIDLGYIVEYMWEDRDALLASPFEHDWLFGTRLTFNDVASTDLLLGLIWDSETEEKAVSLETSRRFGDQIKVSLEGRFYTDTGKPPTTEQVFGAALTSQAPDRPLSVYSADDMIQLELVYYF
ncbi:MAG: hypothetical protein P1U67_07270 [Alcanivoracaceae bacterium]|nr:hypothetical protein [Alcanivoracaceae bacterium]